MAKLTYLIEILRLISKTKVNIKVISPGLPWSQRENDKQSLYSIRGRKEKQCSKGIGSVTFLHFRKISCAWKVFSSFDAVNSALLQFVQSDKITFHSCNRNQARLVVSFVPIKWCWLDPFYCKWIHPIVPFQALRMAFSIARENKFGFSSWSSRLSALQKARPDIGPSRVHEYTLSPKQLSVKFIL